MNHHEVMAMVLGGMAVITAGHTNTERGYLPELAARLTAEGLKAPTYVAKRDVDPMETV